MELLPAATDRSVAGGGRDASAPPTPLKIRISKIGGRYLVFDVADVARLRRENGICAVLVGITPQAPNQGVFSGLPLELAPDEVRWLVQDRQTAYVADDRADHLASLTSPAIRRRYEESVGRQRQAAQAAANEEAAERQKRSAEARARMASSGRGGGKGGKAGKEKGDGSSSSSSGSSSSSRSRSRSRSSTAVGEGVAEQTSTKAAGEAGSMGPPAEEEEEEEARADTAAATMPPSPAAQEEVLLNADDRTGGKCGNAEKTEKTEKAVVVVGARKYPQVRITPTTSAGLVGGSSCEPDGEGERPTLAASSSSSSSSYAMRACLADRGYFATPGLRFGGDLSIYPGDPFRYHAHFVATTYGWHEPIPLLDLVGTGRLATGVKKGLLIGGSKPPSSNDGNDDKSGVRAFTLEWAAI